MKSVTTSYDDAETRIRGASLSFKSKKKESFDEFIPANEEDRAMIDKLVYEEERKERIAGLKPLYFFLTTALNVELVYVILKGISQFSLLNFIKNGLNAHQVREFEEMEYKVDHGGDTTILIRKFYIKNIGSW